MATSDCSAPRSGAQTIHSAYDLKTVLTLLDDQDLLARLQAYRHTGRPGYPLQALWRAYCCSFLLNLPHTNALIRELEVNPILRELCGFDTLPHRTTFNRFIQRLSRHADLVEAAFNRLTHEIATLLPDLGREVAVDSTVVRSHSNPNRRHISDPEASWTAKTSARAKSQKEWYWGYKLHMVADSRYGIPLTQIVTTAKRSDSPELPPLIAKAQGLHAWLRPQVVTADKGYDSRQNHQHLYQQGILPIIPLRRPSNAKLHDGIYTALGIPTCVGQVPMRYVRSDPQWGHLYRCVGCHLATSTRGGIRHCDTEVWEDPKRDIRLFGAVRRDSPEWRELYSRRQAIERVFKSLKESRRLERHCLRGLRQVTLHSLMSVLTFQATALASLMAGRADDMRWMVRRIA